jgi:ribosome biogenesis protein MAK21
VAAAKKMQSEPASTGDRWYDHADEVNQQAVAGKGTLVSENPLASGTRSKHIKFGKKKTDSGETMTVTVVADADKIAGMRSSAESLLNHMIEQSEKSKSSSRSGGDDRFVRQILQSGTLPDKVAALTLLVQESPLHQIGSLETLMAMAEKKGRRETHMAVNAVKDLFLHDLLPSDRKLRWFREQPLTRPSLTQQQLVYWLLEDKIKEFYMKFVDILSRTSHDTMDYMKRAAIQCMFELLLAAPEGEQLLMTTLVNKLGDPDRKVASKVVYLLGKLLEEHPGMKLPIVSQVETMLFQLHLTDRAQFFCAVFLSQILFDDEDEALARKLLDVYFAMFKIVMSRKPNSTKPTASNAATVADGVALDNGLEQENEENVHDEEAEPVDEMDDDTAMATTTDITEEVSRSTPYKKKPKKKHGKPARDVPIEESQAKILKAILTGVNRAYPYAQLQSSDMYASQINDLFKMVHKAPFGTAVQALQFLFQISQGNDSNRDRFYRALYDIMLSTELRRSTKRSLFFHLLFKSLKSDKNVSRACAFTKRLVQVCLEHEPAFVCGALYLLSELLKARAELRWQLMQPESLLDLANKESDADDSDEVEQFKDAPESDEEDAVPTTAAELDTKMANSDKESEKLGYDPRKRDPKYAHADTTCLWDIMLLSNHFHPSVVKFAVTILQGEFISYGGDPLTDFTNNAFLDRFVYRNPKKSKATDRRAQIFSRNKGRRSELSRAAPINTAEFSNMPSRRVRTEEKFMHKFFASKKAQEAAKAKRLAELEAQRNPKDRATDGADLDIDEYADMVVEREIARLGEADADDDMSGFDYSDSESGDDEVQSTKQRNKLAAAAAAAFDPKPAAKAGGGDSSDSDANEEAMAMREAFGGGAANDDDDDDLELAALDQFDGDSDDGAALFGGDDDDSDGDDSADEIPQKGKGKKAKKSANVFADADDFAEILVDAGSSGLHPEQERWEDRNTVGGSSAGSGRGSKRKHKAKKSANFSRQTRRKRGGKR